uniref:Uncharacterized protein n=1 Tax=Arundo donax TaxID=35708 RepID=A0A0A9DNR4_ARUDO
MQARGRPAHASAVPSLLLHARRRHYYCPSSARRRAAAPTPPRPSFLCGKPPWSRAKLADPSPPPCLLSRRRAKHGPPPPRSTVVQPLKASSPVELGGAPRGSSPLPPAHSAAPRQDCVVPAILINSGRRHFFSPAGRLLRLVQVNDLREEILQLAGHACHEEEEKSRTELLEKLNVCKRDTLIELCRSFDIIGSS